MCVYFIYIIVGRMHGLPCAHSAVRAVTVLSTRSAWLVARTSFVRAETPRGHHHHHRGGLLYMMHACIMGVARVRSLLQQWRPGYQVRFVDMLLVLDRTWGGRPRCAERIVAGCS